MVGAGDLLIESGGMGGPAEFTDVRHPDKVQIIIHDAIEENASGITTSAGEMPFRPAPQPPVSSTPLPPPPADVTAQLERLEGLLQRGTITREEFEAQKRRLLGESTAAARMRVVSLVPSVTETLLAWGVAPVGVTRFCEQPGLRGGRAARRTLTSPPSWRWRPTSSSSNDEENRREDADALVAAGCRLHVTHVRARSTTSAPTLAALAAAVGVPADALEPARVPSAPMPDVVAARPSSRSGGGRG